MNINVDVIDKYVYMISIVLVLLVSINTGLEQYNNINIINNIIQGKQSQKIFYMVVAFLAIILALQRQTFLPFLGETVVPSSLFEEKNNNNLSGLLSKNSNLINLKIYAPNAEKVIWWAADDNILNNSNINSNSNSNVEETPELAYNEYKNSGISNVMSDGNAYVVFPCPKSYKVGLLKRILKKHIHYRETRGGMLSEVKTIYLDC